MALRQTTQYQCDWWTIIWLWLIGVVLIVGGAPIFHYIKDIYTVRGMEKAECMAINRQIFEDTCSNCFSGGCTEHVCYVPTYEVMSSALPPTATAVIKLEPKANKDSALEELTQWRVGTTYNCYHQKNNTHIFVWEPRTSLLKISETIITWGVFGLGVWTGINIASLYLFDAN